MTADFINAAFEALGGFFVLNHCRTLLRDKAVKGVSILSTIFFTSWGVWNLYYYPSLGQWASFYGGLFIVAANALWIGLMLKYRRNNKAADRIDELEAEVRLAESEAAYWERRWQGTSHEAC